MILKLTCALVALFFCDVAMAEPLSALASVATSLLASPVGAALAGGLLAKKFASAPAAPTVKPPAVMPLADDQAIQAARQRSIAEMQARSGRASTILSQDDKLGG